MTPAPKYKPGDRVVTSMDGPGTIETTAKIKAMVQLDRGRTARLRLDTLRPETAEDVAKREHKAAMDAWLARKPDSKHAEIAWSMSWGNNNPEGAKVYLAKNPAELRAAAAELLLLADWFAERPAGP